MFSESDISLWESIKRTLRPLSSNKTAEPHPFPKRLRVHAVPERTLMNRLDLHGLTVEEAYQTLRRFLSVHHRENSKIITIITGKGSSKKEGLIHHEIKNWLDTPFFKDKINAVQWLNGGGALEIRLKRNKK
ncbi:MAG: Smr/MutS family protein [Pseudomonadota bacterium]|nr:Smr/MutS family protein [Pseudomonadota bacterium]